MRARAAPPREVWEAVECYREYAERSRSYPGKLTGYLHAWQVASELLAAGRPEEVLEVKPLDDGRRVNLPLDRASAFPRLVLVRARAFEQLGRPVDAVKALDELIEYWKTADEDLPLLVEAKVMRGRMLAAR